MRRLWKCFAKAIHKHIEFSEGFLFLWDLKQITAKIFKEHGIEQEDSINFSYGLGKELAIKSPEIDKKFSKEGRFKNQQNFEKLTNEFVTEKPKNKESKVFEYELKDKNKTEDYNKVEGDFEEDMEYSHIHLEEFMKSLNEHNNNNSFGNKTQLSVQQDENIGNSTLNPEQTSNLITSFLKNINKNALNQDQRTKRSNTEIVSSHVEGIAHTGITLTNSLAYSQTNTSVVGHGQFNSVNLVSGIRSRQKEQDDKIEEDKKIEDQPKN